MSSPALAMPTVERVGPFQFAILALSVVTLTALAADSLLTLPPEISKILQGVDFVACAMFFVDFVVRFREAKSKAAFMKFGWIDLIACVPQIDALRIGRFGSVFRVIRLLRGVSSLRRLWGLMFVNKTRGGVMSVALMMFLLVVFASVAILVCERDPQSNIKTAADAVWWSVTTITTVGYGDRFPVTDLGRVVAMALMFAGVGLFGGLSGIIASKFLGQQESEMTAREDAIIAEMRRLREEVERLREGPRR